MVKKKSSLKIFFSGYSDPRIIILLILHSCSTLMLYEKYSRDRKYVNGKVFIGCGSFFCTRLTRKRRGGRRTPQKRFAPRITSAKTTNGWLCEGLSRW